LVTENDIVIRSLKYCRDLAKSHYENFPVGSILVPKNKRDLVYSIYAFARSADDIADNPEYLQEEKLEKLNSLNEMLVSGNLNPDSFGFSKFLPALFYTIDKGKIPLTYLTDLLSAFKQDSVKNRYDTFEELTDYSSRSANPVGRIVLTIFGYDESRDMNLFSYSDRICTALQLTNFWQDVSVDLTLNRVYIPSTEMKKFGYSYDDLFAGRENNNFIRMIGSLIHQTEDIFKSGAPILNEVKGRLRLELKATYLGGNYILDLIRSIDYRVLKNRVTLNNAGKFKIACKTLLPGL
jgi:squalene synthase HpnC